MIEERRGIISFLGSEGEKMLIFKAVRKRENGEPHVSLQWFTATPGVEPQIWQMQLSSEGFTLQVDLTLRLW